jgi:hypothetical protein
MARWERARRWAVMVAIGGVAAWLWIRLGLYGFGLAVGIAFALPVVYLAWRYVASGHRLDAGLLLGSFGGVWASFEAATWLNAASDPAVSIPGWSPIPLAIATSLLVLSVAIAATGFAPE